MAHVEFVSTHRDVDALVDAEVKCVSRMKSRTLWNSSCRKFEEPLALARLRPRSLALTTKVHPISGDRACFYNACSILNLDEKIDVLHKSSSTAPKI